MCENIKLTKEGFHVLGKINDERIANYTKRTRSGRTQTFYTGNDSRDFERYRKEGGPSKCGHHMHNKEDTIEIEPPEKHYYSELIEGEWYWVNGCRECCGMPRDWMSYVECEKHDVCRTCKTPRAEIKDTPWGGKNGWQCKKCHDYEHEKAKREALQAMEDKEYCELDHYCNDKIICPYCDTEISSDDFHESDDVECSVCDNTFSVEVDYTVTYSTSRKES